MREVLGKEQDTCGAPPGARQTGPNGKSGTPCISPFPARIGPPVTVCKRKSRRRNGQHVDRPTEDHPSRYGCPLKIAEDRRCNGRYSDAKIRMGIKLLILRGIDLLFPAIAAGANNSPEWDI